jgi:hypothetical protein
MRLRGRWARKPAATACPVCGTKAIVDPEPKAQCQHMFFSNKRGWIVRATPKGATAQEQKYSVNPLWRRRWKG